MTEFNLTYQEYLLELEQEALNFARLTAEVISDEGGGNVESIYQELIADYTSNETNNNENDNDENNNIENISDNQNNSQM